MTTVTIAEARENLPELLRRAAVGEQIVITEDGKWLATLTAPPKPPPTPEEIAALVARGEEQVRKYLEMQAEYVTPNNDNAVQREFDPQRP